MLLEPQFDVITAPRHHSLCGQIGDRLALAHNEQLQIIAEDLAEQPRSVRQIASSLGKSAAGPCRCSAGWMVDFKLTIHYTGQGLVLRLRVRSQGLALRISRTLTDDLCLQSSRSQQYNNIMLE